MNFDLFLTGCAISLQEIKNYFTLKFFFKKIFFKNVKTYSPERTGIKTKNKWVPDKWDPHKWHQEKQRALKGLKDPHPPIHKVFHALVIACVL